MMRTPAASLSELICSAETSRLMGMGNSAPSAIRSVETTLRKSVSSDRSANPTAPRPSHRPVPGGRGTTARYGER